MKKITALIILITTLLCLLAACNTESNIENSDITVDSILKLFDDENYLAQSYNDEMIATIRENMAKRKFALDGEIVSVVHIVDRLASSEDSSFRWAYVYEFTDETDAITFEEDRHAFISSAEENGACIRCGHIIVFGTAPEISSIVS